MAFASNFGRILSPTFQPNSQAKKAGDWWLAGGIDPDDCVAAYQPKGAASYAASKVNLANPGTYNAVEGNAPDWDTSYGWSFVKANKDYLLTGITNGEGYSLVIKFSDYDYSKSSFQGWFIGSSTYISSEWRTQIIWASIYAGNAVKFEYGHAVSGDQYLNNTYGVLAICEKKGYLDGKLVKTVSSTGSSAGAKIQIAKGYGAEYVHMKVQAAAIYNTELSSAQIAALSTAMAAL